MPLYRVSITSPLTPVVAIDRIRSLTRTPPSFTESLRSAFSRAKQERTPFLGEINGPSFSLRRNIRYRNSFLPEIRGNVQPGPSGSSIRITMFMNPFTAVFMLVWLWIVGSIAWPGSLRAESSPTALHFAPVGMFVFGIALVVGGFFPEAIKAKRLLAAALGEDSAA